MAASAQAYHSTPCEIERIPVLVLYDKVAADYSNWAVISHNNFYFIAHSLMSSFVGIYLVSVNPNATLCYNMRR
jgi:hypothetical protein